MEKLKANLVIKGDVISNGYISASVGGENRPSLLSKVDNLDNYDISEAIIIDGNLVCNNFEYAGLVIVTGYVAAKSCGG